MSIGKGLALGCCLVAGMAAPALRAEEPGVTVAFKLRGALQLTSLQDGLGSKVLGMGLEGTFPCGKGQFSCEVGYQFKTGSEYNADLGKMDLASSGTVINQDFSVNSQKNKLEGLLLRLGYGAPLSPAWAWKAGLQFGGAKFTNQAIGFITDGSIDAGGNLNNASYLDTYASANSKATIAVSPFASVVYHVDATSSFEVGVLLLNYKSFLYNHVAGTETTDPVEPDPNYVWGGHVSQDSYIQKNRMVPHVEFAYVFHF